MNTLPTLPAGARRAAAITAAALCISAILPPLLDSPAAAAVSGTAVAVHGAAPSAMFTSSHGYSLAPPVGWQKAPAGMFGSDVAYYLPPVDKFATNIVAVVVPEPANVSMSSLASQWVPQNRAVANSYQELSQSMTHIGAASALHTLALTNPKSANRLLKIEEYATIRNGSLYEFVYTALPTQYAAHESAFQKLISSVQWK